MRLFILLLLLLGLGCSQHSDQPVTSRNGEAPKKIPLAKTKPQTEQTNITETPTSAIFSMY